MSHPFAPLFEKALTKSHGDENHVLSVAEELIEKGYPRAEVCDVLRACARGRVSDGETAIFEEVIETLCEMDE